MRRVLPLAGSLFVVGAWVAPAEAACPSSETILSELTCSSTVTSRVSYTGSSDLGGSTRTTVYSCGSPYSGLGQEEAEDVYSFTCQRSGSVTLDISGLDCDLDIYVLDSSCDPYSGCEQGSTAASYTTDSVTFTCAAGSDYYVVIEGYGFGATVSGAGQCRGASEGDYTLSFDVSAGTGCSEDCDNGLDDDFDGDIDCADSDCAAEVLCNCDEDADGYDNAGCGGSDCNDTDATINPGATEYCDGVDEDCDGTIDDGAADATTYYRDADSDGYGNPDVTSRACSTPTGYVSNSRDCYDSDATAHPGGTEAADGVDDDCDGTVDEGTDAYDDDGDGYAEDGGDCDDTVTTASPAVLETCNGLDDDCDGIIDETTDCYDDDGDGRNEDEGDCNDGDDAIGPAEAEVDGNRSTTTATASSTTASTTPTATATPRTAATATKATPPPTRARPRPPTASTTTATAPSTRAPPTTTTTATVRPRTTATATTPTRARTPAPRRPPTASTTTATARSTRAAPPPTTTATASPRTPATATTPTTP